MRDDLSDEIIDGTYDWEEREQYDLYLKARHALDKLEHLIERPAIRRETLNHLVTQLEPLAKEIDWRVSQDTYRAGTKTH